MNNRTKGSLSIFICALIWSTSGLFIKLLDWHPILITGMRSLLASILLFVYRLIFIIKQKQNKPYITINVIIAGFTYAVTMLLFVYANKLTTSANAIMLEYSAPVWAALFGWIVIKEKPRKENWISMLTISIGLFIIFNNSFTTGKYFGDLLALIAGISFGVHSVYMSIQKKEDPIDALLLSHIICILFAIPFFIKQPPLLNHTTISSILFMGIFQIGIASFFFSYGIKRISGMNAMLISAIEPALNPLWVFIFTDEKPSIHTIIGGTIIALSILFSSGWKWYTLKLLYKKLYKNINKKPRVKSRDIA
jgi:drug/metabolite transporter (DMT)-like permease